MKIVYFTHSLRSCWNHGNAHFLRGLLRVLQRRGHEVVAAEPRAPWSYTNLVADHGATGAAASFAQHTDLRIAHSDSPQDREALLDGADLVIVHEWNEPALVAAVGAARRAGAGFTLLFHDTHHRAVSAPEEMRAFDLDGYDGILAFGETLAEVYRGWGWNGRVWTFHEAADVSHFRPPSAPQQRHGLVWIGNWGEDERSAELEAFLLAPAQATGLPLTIHGVRYPARAQALLERYGARYAGWVPNVEAPGIFARHLATVHVPRRFYTTVLPGIPTIRVFEALACGIPLVSAPWSDTEGLFRVGTDFLMAETGDAMRQHLAAIREDAGLRDALVAHGLETIRRSHTCEHRAGQLLQIAAQLGTSRTMKETA
ncbi:glycosyltransferase [Erythrobacteraceae bacterium CFH 75059]|uniref:CgeB family protein n=1 Tax=Qipengyuania thermophila TaxID=2509361 RepID=UPI0010206C1C|nr:glycosyltransferase [Qipengyuania thermophila]TCD05262.1 glycosyltransferase [Erythrobacteraceae bacterium CFH 75059]